jgi:hypothetical protein
LIICVSFLIYCSKKIVFDFSCKELRHLKAPRNMNHFSVVSVSSKNMSYNSSKNLKYK